MKTNNRTNSVCILSSLESIYRKQNKQKQTKTTKFQGEKQIKVIEKHGKQLDESNKVIKNDVNIDRDGVPY